MLNRLLDKSELTVCAKDRKPAGRLSRMAKAAMGAMAALAIVAGCETEPPHTTGTSQPPPGATGTGSTNSPKSLVLQEGDTIRIVFPGSPNLDTTQTIRRDGKISLQSVGEYDAVGKSPTAVEAELKKLYGAQLVNNDVSVTVQASAFVIYVMGAVGRPGKLVSERPLTPMEALIEAGVDEGKSNLKKIQIIRKDDAGMTHKYYLNLYKVLHHPDEQMPDFTLKPYDIIDVPERFNIF